MATFTMSSQRNFVQAAPPKNIFDKAFVFAISLIVLVGGIWATEYLLIYLADKKIAEYQATSAARLDSLDAKDVQAVHDITSRLATISRYGENRLPMEMLLMSLEKNTIPQVRLTEYEYKSDGAMALKGTTTDYRFVAEQILRYRKDPVFATAEVTATDRTEDGLVSFSILVAPTGNKSAQPAL